MIGKVERNSKESMARNDRPSLPLAEVGEGLGRPFDLSRERTGISVR